MSAAIMSSPRALTTRAVWDAERDAAIQHARRIKALPPVSQGEAAELVARFLAVRGVTVYPPRCAAPINSNSGF